jgi:hypothetical protein
MGANEGGGALPEREGGISLVSLMGSVCLSG